MLLTPSTFYSYFINIRFPPKWLDLKKYDVQIYKELSPHKDILLDYKKDNDWVKYVTRFKKTNARI